MYGLTSEEALKRLRIYGKNRMEKTERFKLIKLIVEQFSSSFVLLLLASAVISYAIGERLDALLILVIVGINGFVGFLQEYQAEKTLEKLRELVKQKIKVYRDGSLIEVDSDDLVPGDVILLESGDKVPADCEIISGELSLDESALTGESVPVDRYVKDEIYAGTLVIRGKGLARVVATGSRTRIGKIAQMAEGGEKTPFVLKMEKLSSEIGKYLVIVIVLMAAVSYLQGHTFLQVLELSTSLGVAAVPEGLPVVTMVCLALGAWRMAQRKAVMKTLPAAEALGSVNVLCVDKTGTLTENRLTVKEVWGNEESIKVVASLTAQEEKDPVDIALREWAGERHAESFEPFDSVKKRATAYHKGRMYVKGAPEVVFQLCEGDVSRAEEMVESMASRGLKVLAFASGKEKLELEGLVGLYDPPRKDIKKYLAEARKLGVEVKMITGDHRLTAAAIAREVGLTGKVVNADELDSIQDMRDVSVFARVSPEDKYRIVDALQKAGYLVAMTGDGVNDAPALKKAHVGIALGSGTDIAKEAADIVLLDDNLETIVNAIREGRTIFKNISNSVRYLLSMNLAEILLILMGMLKKVILLKPIQILWMNLVTDSLPAIVFAYDTHDRAEQRKEVLQGREWVSILLSAFVLSLFSFVAYSKFGRSAALNTMIYGELMYQPVMKMKSGAKSGRIYYLLMGATVLIQIIGAVFLGNVIGMALPSKEIGLAALMVPLFFLSLRI